MGRTTEDIFREITAMFIALDPVKKLYGLAEDKTFENQFSSVSLESIIFYCIAYAIWVLEKLFTLHTKEVDSIISNMKPHSARWYVSLSKLFQYGFNLLPESSKFDNEGKTEGQIEDSKIVKHAAVTELEKRLLIKVAKDIGDLAPLTPVELASFKEYMSQVKDAGVQIDVLSEKADDLRLRLVIYYNPMILDSNGARLDGTSDTPILDGINNYLKNLPFNGELALVFLTDALQSIEGVVIPHIQLAQFKYSFMDWSDIDIKYLPNAGYMRIAIEDLDVEYKPKTVIS